MTCYIWWRGMNLLMAGHLAIFGRETVIHSANKYLLLPTANNERSVASLHHLGWVREVELSHLSLCRYQIIFLVLNPQPVVSSSVPFLGSGSVVGMCNCVFMCVVNT
jgi:hypothetical protein